MRYARHVVAAAAIAAALAGALPAHAAEAVLPQPTVRFVNDPSESVPRFGELVAETPPGTTASAVVFTFADDAAPPPLSAETEQPMSPLVPTGTEGNLGAQSGTLIWDGYSTRNFAVYSTDGAGAYSAPTYFSVAAMSESVSDPGLNPGFAYSWTWGSGEPNLIIHIGHGITTTTYGFLSQGTNPAPNPTTAFAQDLAFRFVPFGDGGIVFEPRDNDWLDVSTGARLTLTTFRFNPDFTHFTRTVYPLAAGQPTNDVIHIAGLSERSRFASTTFRFQMNGDTSGDYYQADYRVEYRSSGTPWSTLGSVSSSRSTPGSITVPAHTQGYQVRAVLLTGGANLVSTPHTLMLRRKVELNLFHEGHAGTTRTMTGVATGRKKGQNIEIQRCAKPKGKCSHYRTVTLTRDEHFSLKVAVPRAEGSMWWYRASLKASGTWTPSAVSARVHVIAT